MLAEGEGFEPPARFPVQWFSRPPPSTTRPSLRFGPAPFIRKLFERFTAAFFYLSETVEGIDRDGFAVFEDAYGTGHPIGALTDDEVSHDIESASVITAFVCSHPPAGQTAE